MTRFRKRREPRIALGQTLLFLDIPWIREEKLHNFCNLIKALRGIKNYTQVPVAVACGLLLRSLIHGEFNGIAWAKEESLFVLVSYFWYLQHSVSLE